MSDLVFWGIAAFMVLSGLLVVFSQSLFRSAFFLALAFAGFGMLYFMLGAPLVGAIQILIYAGAVTMLLMFVIMLTRQDGEERAGLVGRLRSLTLFKVFSGALCAALLFALVSQLGAVRWRTAEAVPGYDAAAAAAAAQPDLSALLFGQFAFAFEVVGVLLLAALIGAVVLARTDDAADGEVGNAGDARGDAR